MTDKRCSACRLDKKLEEFGSCKGAKDGKYCYCKPCANAKARAGHKRRGKNPLKVREWMLRHHYGLELADFDRMMVAQMSKCKICEIKITGDRSTHVDHCHETGVVRGLLCTNCNRGIGHLQENVIIMKNAIEYLTKARAALAEQGRSP